MRLKIVSEPDASALNIELQSPKNILIFNITEAIGIIRSGKYVNFDLLIWLFAPEYFITANMLSV